MEGEKFGAATRQRNVNPLRPGDEEQANGHHHNGRAFDERSINSDPAAPPKKGNVADVQGLLRFWERFSRKGKKNIGVGVSLKRIVFSSWINVLVLFIPIAWVAHFLKWHDAATFTLCFLAIIPLERLFEFGGQQLSVYLGKSLGDLLTITLNNMVEATLAIILLEHCELRLLQATIVGVVLLHLLLIPGTAFITGGARVWEQELHPHLAQLNHTLLTIGVLTLLLPAAFYSALSHGVPAESEGTLVTDEMRHTFLQISRGLSVILLVAYIASRIFLHNPPGDDNALRTHPDAPDALKEEEHRLAHLEPEVNQWIMLVVLLANIAIVAVTAEFLIKSLEGVRKSGKIREEWFGLFILPIVSFSADGTVSVGYFLRSAYNHYMHKKQPAPTLAKMQGIDLSIQFTLFWMPMVILLGWWSNKPMTLLFDLFEVAVLLGACFLVNYVTADAKTNWAEGFVMVCFYLMIGLTSWFYTGQPDIEEMLACKTSVAAAVATAAAGGGHSSGSE